MAEKPREKRNTEHELLIQCSADLTSLLQYNLVSVSIKLLAKGLITEEVHHFVLTAEGVSGQKKAAKLVSCVVDRVKDCPGKFHDLISVLNDDAYFKDIVKKITELRSKSEIWTETNTNLRLTLRKATGLYAGLCYSILML